MQYRNRFDRNFNPYQSARAQQQRRPDNNNNSNKPSSRTLAIAGLVSFLSLWYLTPVSDYVVDIVLDFVPLESDIQLGREAWNSMKYPVVADRWGVKNIGYQLVQQLENNNNMYDENNHKADRSSSTPPRLLPWSFEVIHADFVNAFALPGGIVRVTDALLRQLKLSDAELAALLGHEMGHVLHRHSQARLLHDQVISYLLKAVVYEDNDGYDESFGEAIGELLLQSATFLGKQSFSRKDEYQADAMAWKLLADSQQYSPRAVEGLLQKLWDLSGGSGTTSWESTHPGTKDRIEALKVQWVALPPKKQRLLEHNRAV